MADTWTHNYIVPGDPIEPGRTTIFVNFIQKVKKKLLAAPCMEITRHIFVQTCLILWNLRDAN